MSLQLEPSESGYVRLTPALIARLSEHRRGWPKRDQWCAYCREVKSYQGPFERQYPALKTGKPVAWVVAQGLIDYAQERWGWNVTMDGDTEPAAAPPREQGEGVWVNMRTLFSAITDRFEDCDEMYFHNPYRDAVTVARMHLRTVGMLHAQPGETPSEAACIERGQQVMLRTAEEYAQWLLTISRREIRTVMFVVAPKHTPQGREYVPIGAFVVVPLTERAYTRFCAGEILDQDLTPDDVQQPSPYNLLDSLAEPDPSVTLSLQDITAAQVHCVLYQSAYFTRGLRTPRPRYVSIGGAPKYLARLRRLGFRETGKCVAGTDKPIMLLAHPSDGGRRSLSSWASYKVWQLSLRMYQIANQWQWRKEDRLAGSRPSTGTS